MAGFGISKEQTDQALAAMTVGGTSFGLGYLHGRKGNMPEKWNIPLDLAIGVGAHLATMFGVIPKGLAGHVRNIGNGGLGYYFGSLGGQLGQKARKDASELTGVANKRTITAGWAGPALGPKNKAWAPYNPAAAYQRKF
jgi:hypothetical protein